MRQWIDICEVKDESELPILDDRGIRGTMASYSLRQRFLEPIATINGHALLSQFWPLDDAHQNNLFLMDGERPIATFELVGAIGEANAFRTIYSFIDPTYRNKGLGFATYAFLLEQGYVLQSGSSHTRDSIALWKKITRDGRFNVTYKGDAITDTAAAYDQTSKPLVARLSEGLLTEASDAPLFHATNFNSAKEILKSGAIIGRYEASPSGKRTRLAISLSRDAGFHFMNNPIQFVIDGSKLRHRFKVDPYDWSVYVRSGKRREEREERVYADERGIPLAWALAVVLMPSRVPQPRIAEVMRRAGDEVKELAEQMGLRVIDMRDRADGFTHRHLR